MSQTVKVEGVGAITFPDDATPDEIQQTLNRDYPPKSSALGAAGRGFLGGVFPTAAAVGAGALTAAGLEAAGAPETLGTSLLLIPPTLAAGYLAGKLQQKAIHKVAPQVEAQQQQDIQQHPIASTVGELASGLPVMRLSPGAVFRNPAQAAIAAGVGAAAGVAQPLLEGQKPTLRDVATSAAFPLLYGRPRFGGKPTPQKVVEEAAPILPRAAQAATEAIAEQPTTETPTSVTFKTRTGRTTITSNKPLPESIAFAAAKPITETQPTTTEVPSASEVSKTTEVHGDVRPQPVESQGQVPVEKGGEGVQPQAQAPQPEVVLTPPEPNLPPAKLSKAESEAARAVGLKIVEPPSSKHPTIEIGEPKAEPPTTPEPPATEQVALTPENVAKTKEEKAFRATAKGQKAMASRASRIATLQQLNEAIRKAAPQEAYPRDLIANLPDSQIDSMRDSLVADYNKFAAKPPPQPPPPTPGAGPGTPSAAQGPDPTGQSTMAQLTDWIKQQGKISPNVPFTTRLRDSLAMAKRMTEGMDSLTQAKAKAKAAGTALIDRYVNLPKWTNFLDAIGKWVGYDQQTALEVRDFQRQIAKSVPNKMRQEAITNFIQADGDEALLKQRAAASKPNVRRGYELATQLTPEEKLLARQIQQYFDSRLQEGTEAGILKSAVEDYINQVWKRESPATSKLWADLFGIGTLNPNFKFARKRIYESYFEGEQAGLIPKNKGVGYLLSVYDLAFNRALSARGLIKSLHDGKAEDGLPIAMISEPSVRSIKEGDAPPSAFLIKPNVAPEGAVSKDGRPYLPINHWALRDWKWATKGPEGQPVFVQGDMLVHPDHWKHLDNVLKRSRLADHPITGTMLRAGALAKQTKLSLSPFHLTQEGLHGIFHRVNPANLVQLDLSNPVQKALVDHGVMVADPRAQELFAEGMTGGGLVGKIPGLGHLQNIFSEWLFRDYIPRLKMSMAMDALERNRKTYGKKASDDQLLALTAREANAAFGEQNYRLMGRSPTVQDFLRLTLLAPDFLEARGRFVGQALKPFGREQQMALGIMAATVYLGSRILNQYLDDDPHWDKPFSVMHKGKEYRLRTVLGDTQHLLTDWRNFWYNRLSPATRTIMESATSRDDRGIKRTSLEQLKDFMTWFVPIPLQRRTDTTVPQQVMAASGVSSRTLGPQQEIFKIVDDWKKNNPDPRIKEQYEKHRQETLPQSDYSPLRHALQKNDTEAAKKALTELRKTHKAQNIRAAFIPRKPFTGSWASEAKFKKSLTPEQLKLYNQAMAERMELYRRYNRLLTP